MSKHFDTQQHSPPIPRLRQWLAERTNSERATIAQLWSLPHTLATEPEALADALLQPEAVAQLYSRLGERERAALTLVQQHQGSILAAVLERSFGTIREQQLYINPRAYLLALNQPPSPTERLYLLALLLPFQSDEQRTYVIPSDLLPLLPAVPPLDTTLQVGASEAPQQQRLATLTDIEQCLLALLSLGRDNRLEVTSTGALKKSSLIQIVRWRHPNGTPGSITSWREDHWPLVNFARRVAQSTGLLIRVNTSHLRTTRAALDWLQQPPAERTRQLLRGWIESSWDELQHSAGITVQNAYARDLARAKQAVLELMSGLPTDQWLRIDTFINEVYRVAPDFARPDGRYDTWGLRGRARQSLDGFVHWHRVEGEQLAHILSTTLHWLGLVDLGLEENSITHFRLNPLGAALLTGAPEPDAPPTEPLIVQPNFEVIAPAFSSLYARFQLGRIAQRIPSDDQTVIYRLTKKQLHAALEHGILLHEIVRFLVEQSGRPIPQNVQATLREWAEQHGQLSLRHVALLEAEDAALLAQVGHDKRIRLPEIERLTETAWLLRDADAHHLAEQLRKVGYGLRGDAIDLRAPLKEQDLAVLLTALQFYTQACALLNIQAETTNAIHRRVAQLLPQTLVNRSYQTSQTALQHLEDRLKGA